MILPVSPVSLLKDRDLPVNYYDNNNSKQTNKQAVTYIHYIHTMHEPHIQNFNQRELLQCSEMIARPTSAEDM